MLKLGYRTEGAKDKIKRKPRSQIASPYVPKATTSALPQEQPIQQQPVVTQPAPQPRAMPTPVQAITQQKQVPPTPYPHQLGAIQKLLANNGNLLMAHGVGTGKTLTAVWSAENLREAGKAKKVLVVTPAALKTNFLENGIQRITKAPTQVFEHEKDLQKPKGADYNVVSYELFRENPVAYLKATGADTVIVDEMHRARDKKSDNYKSLMAIRPYVRNFIGLTGSVVNNKPSDILPLLDIITNKNHPFQTERQFNKALFEKDKATGELGLKYSPEIAKTLKRNVDYISTNDLGRTDMPKVLYDEVKVEMSDKQKELFDYAMKKSDWWTRYKLRKKLPLNKHEAEGLFSMLQQARAVSNGIHTLDGTISLSESARETPKIHKIIDDVENHLKTTSDGQVVVYSNMIHGGVDVLKQGLEDRGFKVGLFLGKDQPGMTDKERQKNVKDFNAGKLKVIILSSAGVEGLSFNNATFHASVDGHFNPEVIRQEEARSRRIGGLSHRPPEKRTVIIKRYESVVPRAFLKQVFGDPELGSDQWVYNTAKKKDELNNLLKLVLESQR